MKSHFQIYFLFLLLLFCGKVVAQDSAFVCPPCNSHCDDILFEEPGLCSHCSMELIKKGALKTNGVGDKKSIAFFLQDGVEVLDFAGPMEVFSYAGFKVFTVSKTREAIHSQGTLTIIPDYSLEDAPQADILAFFGGNASRAYQDPEVINWVRSQKNIEYYFSVCTGAFILAESGLLKEKTATTFHSALPDFEKKYPETRVLKNVRYVDNGNIITTAGISAGIDGALHLVARVHGFNRARKVAYDIEYDKWTPGEGLLLTDDDPYEFYLDLKDMDDYLGTYEVTDNRLVEIKLNERENAIYAFLEGQNYPLFYLGENIFKGINGQQFTFERRKDKAVLGYRTSESPSVFYKKLPLK